MSDIALTIKDGQVDFDLQNGDLVLDEGLETAALISMFTDRRAEKSELPEGETDQAGWWGDMFSEVDGDQIGSKFWLLQREKTTLENRARAEELSRDAFQWLIEDGAASDVETVAEILDSNTIKTRIDISRPDQESNSFDFVWNGQEIKRG